MPTAGDYVPAALLSFHSWKISLLSMTETTLCSLLKILMYIQLSHFSGVRNKGDSQHNSHQVVQNTIVTSLAIHFCRTVSKCHPQIFFFMSLNSMESSSYHILLKLTKASFTREFLEKILFLCCPVSSDIHFYLSCY